MSLDGTAMAYFIFAFIKNKTKQNQKKSGIQDEDEMLTFFSFLFCHELKVQLLFLHKDRQLRQSHGDVLIGTCIWLKGNKNAWVPMWYMQDSKKALSDKVKQKKYVYVKVEHETGG